MLTANRGGDRKKWRNAIRATALLVAFTAAEQSHAQQTYTNYVGVSTKNEAFAGTNARVYITLYGVNKGWGSIGLN